MAPGPTGGHPSLRNAPDRPGPVQTDLSFHYSRDQRLAMATAPKRPARQGFFKRYRGVLIVLADIAILVILGFLAFRLFGPPQSSARLGVFNATLRALEYGELVFATVTVSPRAEVRPDDPRRSGGDGAEDSRVFVRFALRAQAQDAEAFFDSAPLPGARSGQALLRAALPHGEASERVYAEVRIGDRSVRLSLPLER